MLPIFMTVKINADSRRIHTEVVVQVKRQKARDDAVAGAAGCNDRSNQNPA